jgi:hypothetical protein
MQAWMRPTGLGLIVALVLGAHLQPARGVQLDDLYQVEVALDPEAENPRQAGFEQAMSEMLTRLTGRQDAPADADLLPLIEAAARYVQRWGFLEEDLLAVTFDGRALEAELTRLDQPVWGSNRPLTLVWLALDTGGGDRRLLSDTEAPLPEDPDAELIAGVVSELVDSARRRGVPLVFPALDAEDLALVTAEDVWDGFASGVEAASQRYQADAMLIGRVRAVGGVLTARWQYMGADGRRELRSSIAAGVDWLADIYATQYAVTGSASVARLAIRDVRGFDDYARVVQHLEGLSIVEAVSVEQLLDDRLIVALTTRGSADVLDRALALGNVIEPVSSPSVDPMAVGLDRMTARHFRVLR